MMLLTGCTLSGAPSAIIEDVSRKALALNSESVCNALTEATNRDYCLGLLAQSRKMIEATNSGRVELCSEIPDKDAKSACTVLATAHQQKLALEKREKDELASLQNGASVTDCKKLSDATMKDQCIMNVASRLAYEQQNPKLCKDIEDKAIRTICETFATQN